MSTTSSSAWPPEGLEPLRGKLDAAARHLLWSVTLTALLTLRVLWRGSAATQVLGSDSILLVVGSLLLSVLWLIYALDGFASVLRKFRQGLRAGHDWGTLLDVASDADGRSGVLRSGAGQGEALAPELRRNLLVARQLATIVAIVVALAALLFFLQRVRFAGPDTSDSLTAIIVCVLALFGAGFRIAIQVFERARFPRPESTLVPQAVTGEGAPPRTGITLVGQLLALVLGAATFALAMVVILASVIGPMLAMIATPAFGNVERRFGAIAGLSRFALPVDSSITPLDAGIAFATMDYRRDTARGAFVRRDRAPLPSPPWLDSAPPGLGLAASAAQRSTSGWIDSVQRRLTPEELAWMRGVTAYPGWEYWRAAARASALDIIGGRYELPFGEGGSVYDLPILPISVYRGYARANAWRVRYYLETNRPDSAVLAARELLSLGLRVTDDARTVIDGMLGTILAQEGRDQLERVYGVLRDPQRDTLLRTSREAALRAVTSAQYAVQFGNSEQLTRLVADWRRLATDPDRTRATRWEGAAMLGLSTCTDARSLLRGPSREVRETFDAFLAKEARWASDTAMLELIRTLPLRKPAAAPDADPRWAYRVAGAVGHLFGSPYIAGCLRVVGYAGF
jgi:hypothetical protein